MVPFDAYPHGGRVLLGRTEGSNCRRGYGRKFMQITGQTTCAYCGLDLIASFENWLQTAVDHVVPKSVCKSFCLPPVWVEDCINKVLACSACNGFDNRYQLPTPQDCPQSPEAFCQLRDKTFTKRKERIKERRREERDFFQRRPWEKVSAGNG